MIKLRIVFIILIFLMCSCSIATQTLTDSPDTTSLNPMNRRLKSMQYTIQAGAFSDVRNAVKMEKRLDTYGLEAYYFLDNDSLYKVRFGNFTSRNDALYVAKKMQSRAYIDAYYIVAPEDQIAARPEFIANTSALRQALVETAQRYVGVPYEWGGVNADAGFDCSGLTMSVYRLNGLELPRTSYDQFKNGTFVAKEDLQPGDLVFFDTRRLGRVSHVGIYIGEGKFIHAPSRGKYVKVERLSLDYFQRAYMGGRSYF